MDGGAWKAAVHGVAEGWTRLSDFTFTRWKRKWQPTPVCQTLFFGAPKSLQMVTAAVKLKDAYSLEGKLRPT